MKSFLQVIKFINLKTILFNFNYLPFKQALKFPIIISKNVYLCKIMGRIHFESPLKFGLVQIGYGNVGIFDKKKSRTIWEVDGDVTFGGNTFIGHGSKIVVGKEGTLVFGDNFKITAESSIVAFKEIRFGKDCLLSWEIQIMDTDFHKIKNVSGETFNNPKQIIVGNRVWIGSRSTILKGSRIKDNTIIGVNSLVNKELAEGNCIYAGSPVKFIKEIGSWER